jgi:hypothetical protein
MNWRQMHGTQDGNKRIVPQVEALEERWVPAVNVTVHGTTMFIAAPTTGEFALERIFISDDGTNNVNNITVFAGAEFIPNVALHNVVIIGGGGSEHVTYNLNGSLQGRRTIVASLGGSDDAFQLHVQGTIGPGASLAARVFAGSGDDKITMTDKGGVAAGGTLQFFADGGSGNNRISADVQGAIAAGANVSLTLNGGPGNDVINANYLGVLTGTVQVNANGGGGSDNISATITAANGSTGQVLPGRVLGGPGNDVLTFLVRDFGSAITFNQTVNGGSGIDECFRTLNVAQFFCELDHVVN